MAILGSNHDEEGILAGCCGGSHRVGMRCALLLASGVAEGAYAWILGVLDDGLRLRVRVRLASAGISAKGSSVWGPCQASAIRNMRMT